MQVPKRKSEEQRRASALAQDHFLSAGAITALCDELQRLETVSQPRAAEELRRTSEMGDRSENAAYHEAKGRLMRINTRMLEIRDQLKNAVEIESGPDSRGRVRIGAHVKVRVIDGGAERTYEIVGSSETNPRGGQISHQSPLGSALIGHSAGQGILVTGASGKEVAYEILEVW